MPGKGENVIQTLFRYGFDVIDYFRTGTYSYRELEKLKKYQYMSVEDSRELVNKKIIKMVRDAQSNVPFFHEAYEGFNIANFNGIEDLHRLPISTKAQLRRGFPEKVMAGDLRSRAYYDRTSGSTGEPFEFYVDIKFSPLRLAAYMLFNTWMGVGPNDRHVQIASPKPLTLYNRFRNNVFRKHKMSTLQVKRDTIEDLVRKINAINPVYVEGYAASVYNFSRLVEEMDLVLQIKPKAVIATSEDLIEPHRGMIEKVFGAKVYNRYGSREFSGAVAQECDHNEGLHVNTALCHVEIVDEDGEEVAEGERGRIIVTDLNNYVMPFIRYEIGDTAIRGPDSGECGINFPIIREVKGKAEYFLESKSGERTPIETVASYLFQKYVPEVHNFQFLHRDRGRVTLYIVPTRLFKEEVVDGMKMYLNDVLGDFEVNIEVVEDIPVSGTGKTPFLITYPHSIL